MKLVWKFNKARGLPIGTERNWKGKKYKKTEGGKWVPVSANKKRDVKKDSLKIKSKKDLLNAIDKKFKPMVKKEKNLISKKESLENILKKEYKYLSWAPREERDMLERLEKQYYTANKNRIAQERQYKKELYKNELKYQNLSDWEEELNPKENIWYHGTFGVFDNFDKKKMGSQFGNAASKLGVHLTTSKKEALQYGEIVKKVKVDLGNNKEMNKEEAWEEYYNHLESIYGDRDSYEFEDAKNDSNFLDVVDYVASKAQKEGYDSFTITNLDIWEEGSDTSNIIIFNPDKIQVRASAVNY